MSRSRVAALMVVAIILVAGVGLVVLPVLVFPPTSEIPDPYFTYSNSDAGNLLHYYDVGEGVTENTFEVFFEFPAVTEGLASIVLDYFNLSVWFYDVSTDQYNNSLIILHVSNIFDTSESVQNYWLSPPSTVEDGWGCCGTLWLDLQERTVSSGTWASLDLRLLIVNSYAHDYEGHQFLMRLSVLAGYVALWYQGASRAPYRSAAFNFTLGEQSAIYLEHLDLGASI